MNHPPADWAGRLAAQLYLREAEYRQCRSDTRAVDLDADQVLASTTAVLGYAVFNVIEALSELPEFSGDAGLLPFRDLVMAMGDLLKGNNSDILQKRPSVGKAQATIGRRYIKRQAVTGVLLLKGLGVDDVAACDQVAAVFSAAGVPGRKRSSDGTRRLTGKSIYEWVSRYKDDHAERDQIDQFVASWFDANGTFLGGFPEVNAWIERTAKSPAVQTKI